MEQLKNFLYKYDNVPEVVDAYAKSLRQSDSTTAQLRADILEKYSNILKKEIIYKDMPSLFNGLHNILKQSSPDFLFKISGRRKSLISLEEKLLADEKEDIAALANAGKDLIGFRIVIFTKNQDSQKTINLCYATMNVAIEYFMQKGFTLMPGMHVKGTEGFNPEEHKEVFVPKTSGIKSPFQSGVKDYILTPKKNGYQSLHVVLEKEKPKESFELQVRTINMDYVANKGEAKKREEKQNRRKFIDVDFAKINMPGFFFISEEDYVDEIGLLDSLDIMIRHKTNRFI